MLNFYCDTLGIKRCIFQPNPMGSVKGRNTGDCAIRAYCKLLDKEWDTVFEDLYKIALREKYVFNHVEVMREYASYYNYSLIKIPRTKANYQTVGEFMYTHKYGRYLVSTAKHIVAYIDGVMYDTEDVFNTIDLFLTDQLGYYITTTCLTTIPGGKDSIYKYTNYINLM